MTAKPTFVPYGYKPSEVGLIPEDWDVKPIHKLADKIMVGIASAATHAYRTRGVVLFRNQNIKPGYLDDSDVLYIDQGYEETFRNKRLMGGDLLTARTGYPGTTSIVPVEYEGSQSFTTLITRIRRSFVDSEYLCCYINSEAGQAFFDQNQTGGSQKNVNAGTLKHLPIPLPPTLAEQEAIAEALGDADAWIESLEQLVAKKRQLKQAAMQQLLTGKTRLPGFEGAHTLNQTELGMLPIDWQLCPLRDLIDASRGIRYGIVQPGRYDPNGRFMIRGQDYSESKGWASPMAVFRVSDSIEQRYRNARVKSGDLIMTIVGYCGHVEMVPEWLDGANLTQTTARIAIRKDTAIPAFCKYMLQSQIGKKQVALNVKGAAQPGLNCGDVEKFLVAIPATLAEQVAIARVLTDMDAEITAIEAKVAKARQIKQGMMQELLTGRTRLV
ncbi:MAG: restriction endonuclease subunit S [Candidatus Paceibacterota bacterium]